MKEELNLLFLIGSIRRESRLFADKLLKEFQLTRYEWLVLACLKHAPGISTQSFIKDYIGIDNSYLTKVLYKLEKRQYIIKTISNSDRRNRIIKINPKQTKNIKKIFNLLDQLNDILMRSLKKTEQHALLQSLHKIQDALSKQLS